MKTNLFAAMSFIANSITKAPRRQKRYSQMVTSSDAEIVSHNAAVCTRQVVRRRERLWKQGVAA